MPSPERQARPLFTQTEAPTFLSFVKNLDLDLATLPAEFGYENPVLICLDAVLAINRRYQQFVVPRITAFRTRFPDVQSLRAL